MPTDFNTAAHAAHAMPSAPTISSSSMLVELSISTWTGRKKDKRASEDVTSMNHAAAGVAAVNKKLLGDCAELIAVQKFTANLRNAHYAMTMPWSDTGLRLLPTTQYFKYHQQMTALQQEYERLVALFLSAYDWEIMQAQTKLGDLFIRDEYPTTENLHSKFKFRLTYIPLPDAGDWRLDIGNEAAASMREQYEKFYGDQLKDAMADVWKRAHEALTKMSERLDAAMQGITPDALREDAYLRAQTKRQVDDVRKIIDNLPGLGF